MKKWLGILAILSIATVASYANFDWTSYWYFYDSDGSTFLASDASESVGCFVQLILDTDGDGLDHAIADGTGIPVGSDDQVYMSAWLGYGGGSVPGQFVTAANTIDVVAGAGEDAYIFYGRVWSAPAATWNGTSSQIDTSATYWDGVQFEYTDGIIQTYNISGTSGNPYSANITVDTVPDVIPEPTVLALGVLGLALVRGLRKAKK